MIDPKLIRSQFPILSRTIHGKPLIYLDNAATTLKPVSVIESIHNHYSNESANIHRGVHYLSELGTKRYEESRLMAQSFINAKFSHEVIFTKGTTESINLVAFSLGEYLFKSGDEILISTMEHHSNIVPWQLMAQRIGVKIKEIPIDDNGDIDQEAYKKLLSSGKVKLVSMAWISNALGTINDIETYIKLAHASGSLFMVDAAQAAAHTKIDVQKIDADFLAFSAHKVFGPTGIGILYGKEALLEKMPPYQGGGDMIDIVTIEKTTYNELPHKFEAGTPHIAGGIALKPALEWVNSVGLENIAQYEATLIEYAQKKLLEIEALTIIGRARKKASVASFVIDGVHPHDLGTLLDQQGIAVRTGHHCTQPLMARFKINATTRASFAPYNTKEEIDVLVEGIKKARKLL